MIPTLRATGPSGSGEVVTVGRPKPLPAQAAPRRTVSRCPCRVSTGSPVSPTPDQTYDAAVDGRRADSWPAGLGGHLRALRRPARSLMLDGTPRAW